MTIDLPLIWAGVLALAVLMYVLLDGFDLGIGILFPFAKDDHERDTMMASIAPVWDGNETWLVLGGGGVFVAFPGPLCGPVAAPLPAVDPDAVRADPAGGGFRVPPARRPARKAVLDLS